MNKVFFSPKKRQLKILFLSNLRIDANSSFQVSVFDKLREQLVNGFLGEKLDYLVIIGDLTSDNSNESYSKLEKLINQFGEALLRKDNGFTNVKNRVIIVPGRKDYTIVQSKINTSKFIRFCNRIGKDNILRENHKLFIDNFNDISFVGVPHWTFIDSNFSDQGIEYLKSGFSDSGIYNDIIDYCNSTPTIVLADSSLLFDKKHNNLKRYIESLFKFSLCAFYGETQQEIKVFYRDKNKYQAIDVEGLNHTSNIEAKMMFYRPYTKNMTSLRIDSWQYDDHIEIWKRDNKINGNVDSMVRVDIPKESFAPVLFSQIEKIIFYSKSDDKVVVSGFPGSGKSEFYKYLAKDERFLYLELNNPQMGKEIPNLQQFQKDNEKVENSILLIIDNAYYKVRPEEKEEYLVNLQKALLYLSRHSKGLVYFYSSMGATILDPIKKFAKKNEVVEALDENDFKTLVNQYSPHSPFDDRHISKLTGRFPGYSRLILDDLHNIFKNKSFIQNKITPDSCWDLLTSTFEAGLNLQVECYRFIEEFKKLAAGRFLFNLISSKIKSMLKDKEITEVDFSDLFFEIKDDHDLYDEAIASVEILIEGGVLKRKDDNLYFVNLMIPFLVSF